MQRILDLRCWNMFVFWLIFQNKLICVRCCWWLLELFHLELGAGVNCSNSCHWAHEKVHWFAVCTGYADEVQSTKMRNACHCSKIKCLSCCCGNFHRERHNWKINTSLKPSWNQSINIKSIVPVQMYWNNINENAKNTLISSHWTKIQSKIDI